MSSQGGADGAQSIVSRVAVIAITRKEKDLGNASKELAAGGSLVFELAQKLDEKSQ